MDSIAQSKTGVRSALGPLLERGVPRDVLTGIDLVAQPTPIGLRSESADLINLCEVLRAGGEEYIPRKPLFSPSRERKPQPRHSGKPPFRTRSSKRAACASGSQRQRPLLRQVQNRSAIHSHDPG